ncbi:uncharacterized protein LOC133714715 [Rosa rugosa]|uniref:uncharacterized protein LOC133714715 n=1 Tax=Rosa rugosa TaxID=74645 RepID=UPI002B403669|nr:uncharacterized protein LOC133714715 [Rosa rugosa]
MLKLNLDVALRCSTYIATCFLSPANHFDFIFQPHNSAKISQMAVGEVFLAAFLQLLLNRLTPREILGYFGSLGGVGKKLQKLRETLSAVAAVLYDAEDKQLTSKAVDLWLNDLRHLAYDIDDLLNTFSTEMLTRKQLKVHQTGTSKVRGFFTKVPHKVKFNFNMKSEIDEIANRLQDIFDRKEKLGLKYIEHASTSTSSLQRTPSSCVLDGPVVGRDEEARKIVELLSRDADPSSPTNYEVAAIVGMGGLGKTTLAGQVFNDVAAMEQFDLKIWVSVSDDFDLQMVTRTISENVTSRPCDDFSRLQDNLSKAIDGKKFLIVLDDVWSTCGYDSWTKLQAPFRGGAKGSRILVTTRDEKVAALMGAPAAEVYYLNTLSDEGCLQLFEQHVSNDRPPNFDLLKKKIITKCNGLPLAAKTLGGVLRCKETDKWEEILNDKLWSISDGSNILPVLRLSYNYLPSTLKRCFAYCSVLPNNYEFGKNQLILLWMAEGFLEQPEGTKAMEDIGDEYFGELLSRSFFQNSGKNSSYYVMHDLVGDLARWAAGDTFCRLEDKPHGRCSPTTRHLTYISAGLRYNLTREEECRIARIRGCWRNRNLLDFRLLTGWDLLVDQKLTRSIETPPGNKSSRDAFEKAMDRAEVDNYLETMYAEGLAAQQTLVNPETLALSQSEVPVVLPMPHHSHLGEDGLPVVQAGVSVCGGKKGGAAAGQQKDRMPANRRGPQKEKAVPPADAVIAAREEPPVRVTKTAAGNQRAPERKRRQADSPDEEEGEDVEVISSRQQKRARGAPSKTAVVEGEEPAANELDSFAEYAPFMTGGEREFLFHLCERLGFGGLAGISRPTAIDQSPFNLAFGQISAGLYDMFAAASKQPMVEGELREEIQSLQRELAEAKEKLAEAERRLTKAESDLADARGKLRVAIERDLERNDRVSKLERDVALLEERIAAKDKKLIIVQRESAARVTELKRLEGEVARLRAEGNTAAAAAVEAFKQSAEFKKAMTESAKAGALANIDMLKRKGAIDFAKASQPDVPPTRSTPPVKTVVAAPVGGARSGSGESGAHPAEDSQQTPNPTPSEVSRAGFLAAHTRADGTIETPSPTARGSDQTSRAVVPPPAGAEDAEEHP